MVSGRYGNDPRTAAEIIAQEKRGSILREFPSEFLNRTYDQIVQAARQGNRSAKNARKAKKLLDQRKYDK